MERCGRLIWNCCHTIVLAAADKKRLYFNNPLITTICQGKENYFFGWVETYTIEYLEAEYACRHYIKTQSKKARTERFA
ncbi:TPA: hypothetical protein ACFNMG_001525, partial [Neisseria lactamica]